MKKRNRMSLALVMVFLMLFMASCAKKMTQTDEDLVMSPPEAGETMESPPADDGQTAQLEAERLKAEAAAQEAAKAAFMEKKVHFAYNSFVLSEQARMILNEKADYIRSNPGMRFTVEGHCDERGEDAYNMALGQRRADTVKTFLVNLGVDTTRMNAVSFGENRPIATGRDEASWAQNRRAEFVIN